MEQVPGDNASSMELFENYQDYLALQHLYQAALKQLQIKFEVLNDEFRVRSGRSPIHHIETRLKSTSSIVQKLRSRNYAVTLASAKQNLNDIAGIRVVCSYIDDVYRVAEMLLRQSDIVLLKAQDYIKNPNFNGYRSLHLDIQLPIYLSDHTEHVNVEVQLRTVAMDFWASLEHDLRYKSQKNIPAHISQEMLEASQSIAAIDRQMQAIYQEILALP
mgnify:CR=1 FL=1